MDYTLTNLGVGSNKGYNVSYGPNSMLDQKYAVPLGNAVEWVGDKLNLHEGRMSELIAGGPTKHTDPLWKPKQVYAAETAGGNQTVINPNNQSSNTYVPPTTKTTTTKPTTKTTTTNPVNDFDAIYNAMYPGWGRTEAYADWTAKGRPGLTSTSNQLSEAQNKYNQFIQANPYSDITPGWNPEDFSAQLEEIYQNALKQAQDQETLANQLKQSNLTDIEEQYNLGTGTLGQTKQSSLEQLGSNAITARQQQEQALNEARALYNELTRAGSQRFGGLSGASQYANSIIGAEQQRQMGKTRQSTMDTLRNIDAQKVQVEQNYQTKMQELQVQKSSAIREANNNFSSAINAINADRTTAANEKAMAKMNLLKEYKTQLFNIQSQAKAFEANIQAMREQANLEIDSYLKTAGAATSAGSSSIQSLIDQINKNSGTNLGYGVTNSYNPTNQQLYTGQISKEDLNKNFLQGAQSVPYSFLNR